MTLRRWWWKEFGLKAQDSEEGALIFCGSLRHCIVPLLGDLDPIIISGSLGWDNANTDSIPQPQTQFNILLSFKRRKKNTPANKTNKKKNCMQMTWLMWFFDEHMRQQQKTHIQLGICTRKRGRHKPWRLESSWMSVSEYITIIGSKLLSSLPLFPVPSVFENA